MIKALVAPLPTSCPHGFNGRSGRPRPARKDTADRAKGVRWSDQAQEGTIPLFLDSPCSSVNATRVRRDRSLLLVIPFPGRPIAGHSFLLHWLSEFARRGNNQPKRHLTRLMLDPTLRMPSDGQGCRTLSRLPATGSLLRLRCSLSTASNEARGSRINVNSSSKK